VEVQSVLAHADPDMVRPDPYPHVLIENALPEPLYQALEAEYPPLEVVTRGRAYGSNKPCLYRYVEMRGDLQISTLWRSFLSHHASSAFYAEMLRVFGDHLARSYPRLAWPSLSTGVRGIDARAEVVLDAQIGINTPVVGAPTAARDVHVDSRKEVYNFLLYFRHPDDAAAGGEFLVCAPDGSEWAVRTRVPYRANTLVGFVNSRIAWHAVSPRQPGPYPRRFAAFHAELTHQPLYKTKTWSRYPPVRAVVA
jgi:hypothetical protein